MREEEEQRGEGRSKTGDEEVHDTLVEEDEVRGGGRGRGEGGRKRKR